MALHRGIQSAIFYYLSCAPCAEARHRKKRRREADLAKLEKEALETDGAALDYHYKHTLASNTNPAWNLEIAIGPSKESKAAAKVKAKRDKERDNDVPPRSSGSTTTRSDKTKHTNTLSNVDTDHNAKVQWASTFQRNYSEDTLPPPERVLTNTVSRHGKSDLALTPTISRTTASPPWMSQPNPPLNDLHPATVTRFDTAAAVSWMLEPPPPARVMRGNEPERRSLYSPKPSSASSPRPRAGTGESRPILKETMINEADVLGLEPAFESRRNSSSEDELYELNTVGIEKRDSAGPAPGKTKEGAFLFPPRDWLDHNGIGPSYDYDHSPTRENQDIKTRPRPIRWRWSIDW